MNPNASYSWSPVGNGPGSASPADGRRGIFGRFRYIASIGAFAAYTDWQSPMYVYKVPAGGL